MAVTVMGTGPLHVRWSAVFAGAAVALAFHVCLGLFGSALGYEAEAQGSTILSWAGIFWSIGTAFTAAMLGAIVASRLASGDDANALLHSSLVWCLALVTGAIFLSGTIVGNTAGAGFLWNGGLVPSARDTGPGTALEGAAGSAAGASLLAGIASLFGLGGAIVGAIVARQLVASDARHARPHPSADRPMPSEENRRQIAAIESTLMPPPQAERRSHDETIWSDPAFDRRRSAVVDRRQH
jgi:hypothetical protein